MPCASVPNFFFSPPSLPSKPFTHTFLATNYTPIHPTNLQTYPHPIFHNLPLPVRLRHCPATLTTQPLPLTTQLLPLIAHPFPLIAHPLPLNAQPLPLTAQPLPLNRLSFSSTRYFFSLHPDLDFVLPHSSRPDPTGNQSVNTSHVPCQPLHPFTSPPTLTASLPSYLPLLVLYLFWSLTLLAAGLIPAPSLTLLCRRELPLHDGNRFAKPSLLATLVEPYPTTQTLMLMIFVHTDAPPAQSIYDATSDTAGGAPTSSCSCGGPQNRPGAGCHFSEK